MCRKVSKANAVVTEDARVTVRVPRPSDSSVLLVDLEVQIRYALPEPARVKIMRCENHAASLNDKTHLMPAAIPLNPAPMTMTFNGRYSSIEYSPSLNSEGVVFGCGAVVV
jgi:hypothetical protein